tara:strand:- start:97 stop:843 length:747 start_codon:yes stop_codon:yes gene_type:complete
MKKITLILSLLISAYGFAQNVSTGVVTLASGYSVQFDVNSTEVTMTMILPTSAWLAVALDATGMASTNKDVVVYDSSGLQDRFLNGQTTPPSDGASNQDWTQSSNTESNGVRTVIASRDLNTGDAKDYVFTTTNNTALGLLWATGNGAFGYHGANKGSAASTLGSETIALIPEFNIYPNPVTNELSVQFPSAVTQATISVYSVLGTLVYSSTMDQWNSKINTSDWNTGVYLMNINAADFSQTKRIIKQ